MIDNPTKFGFSEKAGRMYDGEMYVDAIHPTTAAHRHVARELGSFLSGEEVAFEAPSRLSGSKR